MATDAKQSAKRAFVTVLLALAVAYSLVLGITRDSNDASIVKAYRRILLRAHPDKGGSTSDAQKLQESREAWEATRKASGTKGRPKGTSTSSGQSPGAAQDEVADPRTSPAACVRLARRW
jgi:curved DNA-binding protein CbpA